MIIKSCSVIVCFLLLSFSISHAGNAKLKAAGPSTVKGNSADFAGTWKGNEQCQSVSAPVAILVISTDGPNQVYITGVYSMQGKIRGVVKGNTITIPRQEVTDPNFKNMMIEGSLTIGTRHNTLTGVFAVLNNSMRDNCTVNYHK